MSPQIIILQSHLSATNWAKLYVVYTTGTGLHSAFTHSLAALAYSNIHRPRLGIDYKVFCQI